MFLIDPTAILEMLLAGYLLAISSQLLLAFVYTRFGHDVLMADDRWTPAYFTLTGMSWIISAAVATFLSLPIVTVVGRLNTAKVSLLLCTVLILLLFRNWKQRPHQQSFVVTLIFSICIVMGNAAGALARLKIH